jgi:hypothetical protein
VDAGDFQQQQIAEFDLGRKRSHRNMLAVQYVQPNVSFLDRVQRTSNGAIKRSIGNDFPHFQPHLIYSALQEPRGLIRLKVGPKKVPFNFGWTLPGRWASIITLKCSRVGRKKCMPPIEFN